MSESDSSLRSPDPRIQAAIQDYLERVDRGEAVDRDAFIAEHAEIADELRLFIETSEELAQIADGDAAHPGHKVTSSVARRDAETLVPRKVQGASATDSGKLPPRFGRYRILKPLGQGAMGTVYLAEDTQLQRKVALKTPSFDEDDSGELLERFYREARSAATLRHSNICPVFDVGEIDGRHFISMAYIEGRPLSAYIRPDNLQPERQVLLIVRKLALALREAHEHGIVHRDLKPGNVMIDPKGEPIIMDFGLARRVTTDEDHRITQSGTLVGSPAYMSPEQVEGEPDRIGPASDQYSLGVILYELLTGQLPFRGSITGVIGQILTKEPPPPGELRPGLDPRIEALCGKMMAKPASERFDSVKEVADEVARILKSPSPSPARLAATGGSANVSRSKPQAAAAVSITASNIESLYEAARKCMRKRDYDQVVQVLETIPEHKRTDDVVRLLTKARQLSDEVQFLLAEIDEALRLNDIEVALKKADELLKLKPGHHRAKQVQEEYSRYGGLLFFFRRRRLDDDGRRVGEGSWVPWAAIFVFLIAFGGASWYVYDYLHSKGTVPDTVKVTESDANGSGDPAQAPEPAVAPFDANEAVRHQQQWADYLDMPVTYTNSTGMEFQLIPPGRFVMGAADGVVTKIEQPFYLGVHEVTQAQYEQVMGTNPSRIKGSENPAHDLSWNDAVDFCQRLSQLPENAAAGNVFRLPTEAEWEYACRAGSAAAYGFGDEASQLGEYAWFGGDSNRTVHPVGQKKANAWSLYDMHGNVYEWCQDPLGEKRALRGGCWFAKADACASASRRTVPASDTSNLTGFRVVLEIDTVEPTSVATLTPYEVLTSPDWEWSNPVNLGPAVNSSTEERAVSISDDGLTLLFGRYSEDNEFDLWMSRRVSTSDPFEPATSLGNNVNSRFVDVNPFLSRDGTLLFTSTRPDGRNAGIWMSKRSTGSDAFAAPVLLAGPVNTEYGETTPSLSSDGLTLLFASDRPGGQGSIDLWMSTRSSASESFGPPVNLGAVVNSDGMEIHPQLSADGLVLLFVSIREDGYGGMDLWMSSRRTTNDPFGHPVNLGPAINSNSIDRSPSLSSDGRTLYFCSSRNGSLGSVDVWVSQRVRRVSPSTPLEILTSPELEWTEPVYLSPAVNDGNNNSSPRESTDGLTLIFSSDRPGGSGGMDLWKCTRESVELPWTDPVNLGGAVNSKYHEYPGYYSPDGRILVFSSGPHQNGTGHRLWMTERSSVDDPWPEPTQIGEPVTSEQGGEYFPTLTADALTLVYASNRPGSVAGEGASFWNQFNLWMTTRRSIVEPWLEPVPISRLNTRWAENNPFLTPDGRVLLFSSTRDGNYGGGDIYYSARESSSKPWPTPVHVGPPINNGDQNGGPALSVDGTRLLFHRRSDRGAAPPRYEIMESRRVPRTAGAGETITWTDLFNGRDLTGWQGSVGDPLERSKMSAAELAAAQAEADERMHQHWKVVDGVLEFDGDGDNLCTARDYGDFELSVDWKIEQGGDSGIYLRGCPQVQIWDPDSGKPDADKGSGGLYNNKSNPRLPDVRADRPVGEWNTFLLRMVGDRVTVDLNGQRVVDNVVMENSVEPGKPLYPTGPIELQKYGARLWFRNIRIREFNTSPPGGAAPAPLTVVPFPDDARFTDARPLSELNKPGDVNAYPWFSPDGLTIYWTREGNGVLSSILQASRPSLDAPFGEATSVLDDARLASVSPDGLEIVCLFDADDDGNNDELCTSRRNGPGEVFSRPQPIGSLQSLFRPKGTAFSADGLSLLILESGNPNAGSRNGMLIARRSDPGAAWGPAERLTVQGEVDEDGVTWPSFDASGDHLLFSYSEADTRYLEWGAVADRTDDPLRFDNARPLLLDGERFVTRGGRYCAVSGELFFTRPIGSRPYRGFELWVARAVGAPALTVAPPRPQEQVSLAAVPATMTYTPKDVGFPRPDVLYLNPADDAEAAGSFQLNGNFVSFSGLPRIEMARGVTSASPLTYSVLGDGKLLWESKPITSANDRQRCEVDVSDVGVMELKVKRQGQARTTLAAWLQPRLTWEVPEGLPPKPQAPWPVPLSILDAFGHQNGPWPVSFTGADMLVMHPPRNADSRVSFRLGKQFECFRAVAHVGRKLNEVDPTGVVTFRAFGDGKPLWWSGEFHNGKKVELCDISVTDVDVLELRTHCDGDEYAAHACWFSPYLFTTPLPEIDFDFGQDNEGWFAAHSMSTVAVENGVLRSRVVGRDPYLTRTFLNVAPDRYSRIVVRMRITGSQDNSGSLFWQTASEPFFSSERYVSFKTNPDGEFHDYVIEPGEHEQWRGQRITGLRLDPEFKETADATVEIDSIRGE